MLKAQIYSIVIARFFIIFVGYLFAALFFILQILGQIGTLYLTNLFAFITSTRQQIADFDNALIKRK